MFQVLSSVYKGLKDQTLRQTGKGCGSLLTLTCAKSAETGFTWCPEHPCTSPGWRVTACCCSVTQSCPTLCNPMDCSTQTSLSFTISLSLLRLIPIELVMPSHHLVLCRPLLLLPSIFPSIRVFSNKLCHLPHLFI